MPPASSASNAVRTRPTSAARWSGLRPLVEAIQWGAQVITVGISARITSAMATTNTAVRAGLALIHSHACRSFIAAPTIAYRPEAVGVFECPGPGSWTNPGSAVPWGRDRTILPMPELARIDFLPEDFRAWASEHLDLLELIASEFQASGTWPSVKTLTRKLIRLGQAVPVQDVVFTMPKPLGHLEHNPDHAVLTLFGLRCTDAGMPLVNGFGQVVRLAIGRYQGDDPNPMITREDVTSVATVTGANPLALQQIVLWESPFFESGQAGLDDYWEREISDAIVRYWNAETMDGYLRQRASELRHNPQLGWPLLRAQYEAVDIDPDVGVSPASADVIQPSAPIGEEHRDVFISHAGEDKADVARPIAEALSSAGWSVWLDEYELTVGDRLTQSINAGLASSRFGVVVLSRAFFDKRWPQEELEGLAAKEAATGSKVILPVWHGIDEQYLADVAPMLAGRLGVSTTKGIPYVAQELIRALARERQASVDPERRGPIVRSIELSERDFRQSMNTPAGRASDGDERIVLNEYRRRGAELDAAPLDEALAREWSDTVVRFLSEGGWPFADVERFQNAGTGTAANRLRPRADVLGALIARLGSSAIR